jgi:ATP-binding cassette, subfamily C, bacterial LapB
VFTFRRNRCSSSPEYAVVNDHFGSLDDPLLGCLVVLTQCFDQHYTPDVLTAGLPLQDNKLTPELFVRAASRINLSARIVKRRLHKIPSMVLPAVVLLKDQQAVVITEIDAANDQALCLLPESEGGQKTLSLHTLEAKYTGYAVFVQPSYAFSFAESASLLKGRNQHWFWGTLWQSWRIYRDVLVASLMINLFALASPLFVMNVYDRVVPNNAIETLWVLAIGAAVVFSFDILVRFLRGYFIDVAGKKAYVWLSSMIFEKVLSLKFSVRPPSVGAFANNLKAFESVRDFITSATITTVIDLPFVVLFLFAMYFIGGDLVWVPVVSIPVILLYALLIKIPLERAVAKTFAASAEKNGLLIETLVNAETIKATTSEGMLQRQWEQNAGFIAKHGMTARLLSSSVVNVAAFAQQLSMIGVVVLGVYLITDGELTMGGLIASVILMGRAMAPMGAVANLLAQYQQTREALHSLNNIMQLPVERVADKAYVQHEIRGGITFDNVHFTYPNQEYEVLNGVSFSIQPGERVAIIGRIGSGKSTIEKLIMGLYEPTNGQVLLDGIGLQQLDPMHVRRNIGYVPQNASLMQGTIKQNIVMGAPFVGDDALSRAAECSGISTFVHRHPMGYDLQVGERGENLSGGQRQMTMIARATLLEPSIYIMDEPTNEMDNLSEEYVKNQLIKATEGNTVLIVTHRASMLRMVDRIIVIEDGSLLADGPKDEVLAALKAGKVQMQAEQS